MSDNFRLHSLETAVLVPSLQAVLTGVFFSLAVVGLAILAGITVSVVVLAGAGVAASLAWLYLLRHWLKLTSPPPPVQLVEDYQAPPAEVFPTIRVEVAQERTLSFIDLPCGPDQLAQLAAGVLSGNAPLAESAWTGRGRPFSRGQFSELRQVLLTRGLAVWRNEDAPAQGIELTCVGRQVLKHCLTTTTPLLAEDRTQEDY